MSTLCHAAITECVVKLKVVRYLELVELIQHPSKHLATLCLGDGIIEKIG